jgi:polyhydroxyalkanoate synthesis regulator phasin
MGKGKNLAIGISGVLIGGMLLTGGMAFAASSGNSTATNLANKIPWVGQMMGHRGGMMDGRGGMMGAKGQFGVGGAMLSQENLDQLVKEGTITQAKADEIKAYDNSMVAKGRRGLLNELVTSKILTQAEADTIQVKLKELGQAQSQQQISDSLKTLVDKGTITQEQSDKILKSFADAAANRAAQAQKIENMTVKEARQYMQDNQGKTHNSLEQLVTDGVITHDQADAFKDAMAENAQKQNQQRISDGLKALVDKGTITQAQADKILAKLDTVQKDREALREKIKNMTAEERQQYMKNNQLKPENPISQLVTDGTITQEQADALAGIVGKGGPIARGGGRR